MIDLRSEQLVQHIHSGGEQNALIGLTGAPANDFRQEGFSCAGIPNQDDTGSFGEKLKIQQAQDARLELHAALMVFEVEAVNGVSRMQPRQAEAAFDGTVVTRLQFKVCQAFQCLYEAEIPGGGISNDLIELAAHRCQAELIQFRL